MNETTIFPREKRADFLFEKILNDPWACEKLQETFANYLCYNDDAYDAPLPANFGEGDNYLKRQGQVSV